MRRLDSIKEDEITYLSLNNIIEGCRQLYNGIWVRSDKHPCGWDFIDLSYVLVNEDNTLQLDDISNSCYDYHELDGLDLKEILQTVKYFWLDGVPEESFVSDNGYAYSWNGK